MSRCLLTLVCLLWSSWCLDDDEICLEGSCIADPAVLLQVGLSAHLEMKASRAEDSVTSSRKDLLVAGSSSVVAITYCDADFAPIWPVFKKCYERAFGCSTKGNESGCIEPQPRLMDIGLESPAPGKVSSHCVRTFAPDSADVSLLSAAITPENVPLLIANAILEQLTSGHDVLRLDADVFFIRNPMHVLQKDFPDADIIASPDCTHGPNNYCGWYRDNAYNKRHNGSDPLADVGFMINTGIAYIRSNPKTISMTEAAVDALKTGRSTYEQVALNEELAERHCKWTTTDLEPLPGGFQSLALLFGSKATMLGQCDEGLKAIVLPYNRFSRALPTDVAKEGSVVLAMHPGGKLEQKIEMLPAISPLCDSL